MTVEFIKETFLVKKNLFRQFTVYNFEEKKILFYFYYFIIYFYFNSDGAVRFRGLFGIW